MGSGPNNLYVGRLLLSCVEFTIILQIRLHRTNQITGNLVGFQDCASTPVRSDPRASHGADPMQG